MLGDAAAPWEQVSAFYNFWFGFKSWREFPHEDEEDPETADCREHKRHIERANAKLRERAKKDEIAEVTAFVEAAYKFDPRVQARLARSPTLLPSPLSPPRPPLSPLSRRSGPVPFLPRNFETHWYWQQKGTRCAMASSAPLPRLLGGGLADGVVVCVCAIRSDSSPPQAEEKAAKQAKKDQKKGALNAKADEEKRAAEAAKAAAEEAERAAAEEREAAKKNKEAARKALQREKKRLRTASEPAVASASLTSGVDDVDRLCNGLDIDAMQLLCSRLEAAAGDLPAQAELLTAALCTFDSEYRAKLAESEEKRKAKVAEIAAKQAEEARQKQERRPWTADDVKVMDKALKQFPHGTLRRWEQVAAYMGDRTPEEVLEMSKIRSSKARRSAEARLSATPPCAAARRLDARALNCTPFCVCPRVLRRRRRPSTTSTASWRRGCGRGAWRLRTPSRPAPRCEQGSERASPLPLAARVHTRLCAR